MATAIVDVGHDRTDVAVFSGTSVQTCRTLSRAGRHLTAALQRELSLSPARAEEAKATVGLERRPDLGPEHAMTVQQVGNCLRTAVDPLVRDLRQTLGAYRAAAGVPVGQIVLAGAGSRLRGLAPHLSAELGVPVSSFAFPAVPGAPVSEAEGPCFAKALALALRGTSRTKRIDFRRGAFAPKSDTRSARGVMVGSALWVGVLALAWGFAAFAHYSVLQSEGESQGEQLRTLSKQLLGEEIDDFVRAKALAKGTGGDSDPTPHLDAFGVLDELSRRVPREMTHDLDDLDVRPDRVTMRGQVTSLTDVDSLYTALSEVECFPQIEKGRTTRTVDGSRQKYTFEVTLRCPDPDGEEGADTPGKGPTKANARRTTSTRGTAGQDEEAL
jgi:cell division ATPase FtsA